VRGENCLQDVVHTIERIVEVDEYVVAEMVCLANALYSVEQEDGRGGVRIIVGSRECGECMVVGGFGLLE
jgi:hypothetical protein